MNKGLTLRYCSECKRNRFCSRTRIPGVNFRYVCSKGHTWIIKGVTMERVHAALEENFNQLTLENLFNRNDTFYDLLKK